jgi:hypothetical protein
VFHGHYLDTKSNSINRNSSNIYDRRVHGPSYANFEDPINEMIFDSAIENISEFLPKQKNVSKSRSKPRMLTEDVNKDIVTFERLQRLIIINSEVTKLMTSRLATYNGLYQKYFQSQMSTSAPKKTISHDLYEDANKF